MRDVDDGFARSCGKGFDDGASPFFIENVEPVERFVENEQVGVFHHGAGEKQHALFARREFHKRTVAQPFHAECLQPARARLDLSRGKPAEKTYRVVVARGHDFGGGNVFEVGAVYLG